MISDVQFQDYLEDDVEGLAPNSNGGVTCLKCGKVLSNVANGRRHYNTVHQFNMPEKCTICKTVCKNKQALEMHMRRNHGITPKMMKNVIKPVQNPRNEPSS